MLCNWKKSDLTCEDVINVMCKWNRINKVVLN